MTDLKKDSVSLSGISACVRAEPSNLFQTTQQLLIAETLRRYGGCPDLVLIGDSLTQNWQWHASWSRIESGRKVLNLGLGGDRTEHLLWRLEQGIVDNIPIPRAALLIGINNIWLNLPASKIVQGIACCVERMRRGVPQASILVYGLFPLSKQVAHFNSLVREVNSRLADAVPKFGVAFRDIGKNFQDESGNANPELMYDGCHLTEPAYQIWTEDLIAWLSDSSCPQIGDSIDTHTMEIR